jgi:transposase
MGRRLFSQECKLEAIKLARERGVTTAQAARDLGLHQNVLRKWVKDHAKSGPQTFPGRGKQ